MSEETDALRTFSPFERLIEEERRRQRELLDSLGSPAAAAMIEASSLLKRSEQAHQ